MKPHLNSPDPDYYFNLQQITHIHKYKSPEHVWFFNEDPWIIPWRNQGKSHNNKESGFFPDLYHSFVMSPVVLCDAVD